MIKSFTKKTIKTKIKEQPKKKSDVWTPVYHTSADKQRADFDFDLFKIMINARDSGKMTVKQIERFEYDSAGFEYIMDLFDLLVPLGYKLAIVPVEETE